MDGRDNEGMDGEVDGRMDEKIDGEIVGRMVEGRKWRSVRVGELVVVRSEEAIPVCSHSFALYKYNLIISCAIQVYYYHALYKDNIFFHTKCVI